jgi:site-specific DNA recombinase
MTNGPLGSTASLTHRNIRLQSITSRDRLKHIFWAFDRVEDHAGVRSKQVGGYARVSTEDRARDGVSIAAQQAKIEAYATVKDWGLPELIRNEGESAKHLKRPGLERLLALVEGRRVEAVIVYQLDRLTPSVVDLDKLRRLFERKGVALVSRQESLDATTATGRLMMNLLASVGQWERKVIGERPRNAMQHLKAQGKRYCYAVFGARHGEASTLAWMQAERRAGRSYEAIAGPLNAAGAPTATRGGGWLGNTLRQIRLRTSPIKTRRVA